MCAYVCEGEKSIVQRVLFIRQTIFVPLKSHITYICMHTCIHQHFVEIINKSVYIRTNCAHTYCIFRSKKSTNFIRMQYLPAQTYISPICDISHPRALSSASINFVSLWNYGRRILPMCKTVWNPRQTNLFGLKYSFSSGRLKMFDVCNNS